MLDDTFNLALANLVPYAQAMDLTLYLKNEREYVPWNAVLEEFDYIDSMLYNLPEYTNWKVIKQLRSIFLNNISNFHLYFYWRDT